MNQVDYANDLRKIAERQRAEDEERRNQQKIDQRSLDKSPEMRVRIWEQLHKLTLPRDPEHAILFIIAQQTGLNVADVRGVQQLRLDRQR